MSRNVRGGDERPAAVTGAFRPVAARPPLEHGARYCLVSTDDLVLRDGDPVVARDDDDVGERQRPARVPELPATAVNLVGGDPPEPQPRGCQASDLRDRDLRLRGELQALRDPGLLPAPGVLRPRVRHVHVEVAPGLPERGDQGGEHPGHAVLHLAGDARVLGRGARGGTALPQVSGLVDRDPGADQVVRVVRQARRGQRRQRAAQLLPRPLIAPEQGLHPVRALMPGRLSQLPAVRPRVPR
jgi:hypothetical protein